MNKYNNRQTDRTIRLRNRNIIKNNYEKQKTTNYPQNRNYHHQNDNDTYDLNDNDHDTFDQNDHDTFDQNYHQRDTNSRNSDDTRAIAKKPHIDLPTNTTIHNRSARIRQTPQRYRPADITLRNRKKDKTKKHKENNNNNSTIRVRRKPERYRISTDNNKPLTKRKNKKQRNIIPQKPSRIRNKPKRFNSLPPSPPPPPSPSPSPPPSPLSPSPSPSPSPFIPSNDNDSDNDNDNDNHHNTNDELEKHQHDEILYNPYKPPDSDITIENINHLQIITQMEIEQVHKILTVIPSNTNTNTNTNTLFHALSLALAGNTHTAINIEKQVNNQIGNVGKTDFTIFSSILTLYKCNILFFHKITDNMYKIYPMKNQNHTSYFIYINKTNQTYQALITTKKSRPPPKQLQNITILFHNTKSKSLSLLHAKYNVTYTDNNTDILTFYQLKNIKHVLEFIQNEFISNQKEKLSNLITNYNIKYGVHNGIKTKRKKGKRIGPKNYTGKKFTEILKIDLKGKGGCYCFMPYETIDAKENAIFKIGMTKNFDKRADQYHTYFPNGVYMVAFLAEPSLNTWKNRNKYEKMTISSKKTIFYKEIESFLFKYITIHKGDRIFSNTRVQHANNNKSGATEWFYCNEDIIHDAFDEARKRYGGEVRHFYLEGIDANNGENISINNEASKRRLILPTYKGEIIYNL